MLTPGLKIQLSFEKFAKNELIQFMEKSRIIK